MAPPTWPPPIPPAVQPVARWLLQRLINERLDTFQPTRRDDAVAAEYLERCGLFFRINEATWSVRAPSLDLPPETNENDPTLKPPTTVTNEAVST